MNLLAIETSTTACSVGLAFNGKSKTLHEVKAREHTQLLLPMIRELTADIDLRSLDAVALGNGPGSFIGMRIGAAVAQGIAYGASLPIIPVSSLAAVAAGAFASSDADKVVVLQDARMSEVYAGCFQRGPDDLPEPLAEESILPVAALDLPVDRFAAAGDGWNRYPDLAEAVAGLISEVLPVRWPHAGEILRLAAVAGTAVAPQALEPAYLRSRVASPPA